MAALEIHPTVAPQSGEVVVTKVRASAFSGSDFEVILRSQAISNLVLCGIATSGVVLSTVLEAARVWAHNIATIEDLCRQVQQCQDRRNQRVGTVNWQFRTADARIKLSTHQAQTRVERAATRDPSESH